MSEWQPTETAPKDGPYLIARKAGRNHAISWPACVMICLRRPLGTDFHIGGLHWESQSDILGWMPLPEPPTEKGEA